MPIPHALAALIEKRADLGGEIYALEQRLLQARANLVHLDATIRLLDPEFKPEVIVAKTKRESAGWFTEGELPRTVLDILRTAPTPLNAKEIAQALMQRRGFGLDDAATLRTVEGKRRQPTRKVPVR